jgi:tetratricopeptide (TPR) repeat protein
MTITCIAALGLSVFLTAQAAPAASVGGAAQRKAHDAEASPGTFEQLAKAADRARNENDNEDAIRLYRRALSLRPAWPEGLWYLGILEYEKERFLDARDVLRRFVTYDPSAGPGWAVLGMSEFKTREYSRAFDHLRRAMALGMGGRKEMAQSVFYFVAVLLTRFEQYNESMNMLLAMVKSGQKTDLLVEPLGLAALRMPLLPAEIPPDRRDMIRMAGQGALAVEAGRQDEAERLFGGIVAASPNEPGGHFLYGVFLLDLRPADGIAEIKRELEISPFHVAARLRLVEEYLKEERFDEGLMLAEEAVKLEPKDGPAHMMLGEVLIAKGDLAGGIRELETSEKQAPQTVRTRWDLLRAYTTAGRKDDAQREKEEIEKLNAPTGEQGP